MADNATKHLAVVDVQQIQAYLLKSPRFRVVRGASRLLAQVNEEKITSLATGCGEVVYSTGGRTEALFPSRAEAEGFCRQAVQHYRLSCPGVEVSWAVGPCADPAHYRDALRPVEAQLAARKCGEGAPLDTMPLAATPFTLPCQDCGEAPAIETVKPARNEPPRLVCAACANKHQAAQELSAWPRPAGAANLPTLEAAITQTLPKGVTFRLAENIEEIASCGLGGSYVALIACDGDGVGAKKYEQQSCEQVRDFSRTVVEASTKALNETVCNRLCEWQRRQSRRPAGKPLVIPVLVLLHGGDDLLVMTTGSDGLALAADFCRAFAREGARYQLTASAGVAIAHPHHPLHALNRLAHELLQSAKQSRNDGEGSLDFHVVQTPSERPLHQVRRALHSETSVGGKLIRYELTCRPYALASNGDDKLQALLEATRNMGPRRTGFPRGVLHALPSLLSRTGAEGEEYGYLRARLDDENRQRLDQAAAVASGADFAIESACPWAKDATGTRHRTALLDLEEIVALEPSTPTGRNG